VLDSRVVLHDLSSFETDEQRLKYTIEALSALLIDVREMRKTIDELTARQSMKDAPSSAHVVRFLLFPDEDPSRRWFIGLGPDQGLPLLNGAGRIRNRKFSRAACKSHIHNFFSDSTKIANEPLPGRFQSWLLRRYGEDYLSMAYSFYFALDLFRGDVDCYLFQQLLHGRVVEDVWHQPYYVLSDIRKRFEKAAVEHGGVKLPRDECLLIVGNTLFAWSLERRDALFAHFAEKEVAWKKLFAERNHVEGPFVQDFRSLWLMERLELINEIKNNVLEDISVVGDSVTAYTLTRAVCKADPMITDATVLELVRDLFGDAVISAFDDSLLPIQQRFARCEAAIPLSSLEAKLHLVPSILRSSRKELHKKPVQPTGNEQS
jgi:hypothetical protein